MAIEQIDQDSGRYGNAFLLSDAPDHRLPQTGMPAPDAMRLLGESSFSTASRCATWRRS